MTAMAMIKLVGREMFMVNAFERGDRDETKDWRKFAIPALGSLVLVLVGVIISLVTLDRGGIKSEICDLRTELRERASENKKTIQYLLDKDRLDSERLRELELLIRLSYPERNRLFLGDGIKLKPKEPYNGKP